MYKGIINILKTKDFEIIKDSFMDFLIIIVNRQSIKIDLEMCAFDVNRDMIIPYRTKEVNGFVVYNNSTCYEESTLTIINVKPDLGNELELIGKYKVGKYDVPSYLILFRYDDDRGKKFTVNNKTFGLEDLEKINEE